MFSFFTDFQLRQWNLTLPTYFHIKTSQQGADQCGFKSMFIKNQNTSETSLQNKTMFKMIRLPNTKEIMPFATGRLLIQNIFAENVKFH